jgi:hypothetical protein
MVSRFFQILNSQIALVTILGLKIIIDNKLLTQMMKFRWGLAVIGPAQDAWWTAMKIFSIMMPVEDVIQWSQIYNANLNPWCLEVLQVSH